MWFNGVIILNVNEKMCPVGHKQLGDHNSAALYIKISPDLAPDVGHNKYVINDFGFEAKMVNWGSISSATPTPTQQLQSNVSVHCES